MSVLKLNNLQIGQSATATNNFTWYQPTSPDGTLRLGLGNGQATSQDLITVNSAGNLGLGVTPSAWQSSDRLLQVGGSQLFSSPASGIATSTISNNLYLNTSGSWTYLGTGFGHLFTQSQTGRQQFWQADSGTGGSTASLTTIFSIRKGHTTVLQGGSESTGTGIAFPATQSASSDANTLDDYEEGTWTPALKFGGNSAGMSITTNGKYTKIGNVVYWACDFALSAKGSSSGSATITGLPFTSVTTYYPPSIVWAYNMNSLTGSVVYRVSNNSTTIDIFQYSSTGTNNGVTNTEYNDTSQMRATGFYYIS